MFPYKSHLKIHLEKCNGLKKQKLKNVEYHFIEDDNSGRRYKCHKCEKKFITHEIVTRHINQKHRENIFKCEHCKKLFSLNNMLTRHKKVYHEKSLNTKCVILF